MYENKSLHTDCPGRDSDVFQAIVHRDIFLITLKPSTAQTRSPPVHKLAKGMGRQRKHSKKTCIDGTLFSSARGFQWVALCPRRLLVGIFDCHNSEEGLLASSG